VLTLVSGVSLVILGIVQGVQAFPDPQRHQSRTQNVRGPVQLVGSVMTQRPPDRSEAATPYSPQPTARYSNPPSAISVPMT
jgi:hypothetical protein